MAEIKGILFDLGNTLLDFGPVDTLALFREGGRLAYAYLREANQPVPGFRRFLQRQLWTLRWRYLLGRVTGREFDSLHLLRKLSRRMGQTLSEAQLAHLAWLWYEPLSRLATLEPRLPEMLEDLSRRRLRLGIISNTFIPAVVLDRHLRQLDLLRFFPVRVYSCDVGYRKPDRRIFRIALERLGTPAAQTIYVGDNVRCDVRGSAGAGMISVLKAPGPPGRAGGAPEGRISSLLELPAVLER